MALTKLAHYSIRTRDVEASGKFYTEILGLRSGFRPPFRFPGLWLYLNEDESDFGVVHLLGIDAGDESGLADYLGDKALGQDKGTGALDHIAFLAKDWPAMRARCRKAGVDYVERVVPAIGLFQVFLKDPSGITIELNYPAAEAES